MIRNGGSRKKKEWENEKKLHEISVRWSGQTYFSDMQLFLAKCWNKWKKIKIRTYHRCSIPLGTSTNKLREILIHYHVCSLWSELRQPVPQENRKASFIYTSASWAMAWRGKHIGSPKPDVAQRRSKSPLPCLCHSYMQPGRFSSGGQLKGADRTRWRKWRVSRGGEGRG